MSRKEKLRDRILSRPRDITWEELGRFLHRNGFTPMEGKGSRVKFTHADGRLISLHRPHPGNIVKKYVIDLVITSLGPEQHPGS